MDASKQKRLYWYGMGKLIDLLTWYKRKSFSKELKDILLAQPRIVDWNNCVNKDGLYEIVFTRYDVGLLSPNGQRIYSRYSPYHPLGKYGNVPVKDNLYHWYRSGIYLDSIITWQENTSQQEGKNEILTKFGYREKR